MQLKDIDLNLLLVFDRMLAEKRVSAVAESLGLSQPAISNALARLRRLLGDELFLRTARGMEPTPFALQLAEPVAYAMGALHTALNQQVVFDPATSTRSFTLAMTDIGEIYFTPRLMDLLSQAAPGVTISTVRNNSNSTASLRDELESGHVDIAIGLLPQLKAGVFQRRLFLQRYVCLFSGAHPLAQKRSVSLKDFVAADHLLVQAAGTGHGKADDVMAAQGIQRRIRLRVPHFVAIGHILRSSDMIATVPERLAQSIAEPFGLVWRPHPVALPQIAINLFWHAKVHRDPGNQWLRGLLFDKFADAG
ncbi:DNA-binding transcriptional LysR family regulator [Variovorax sp. TBS-050B]|uniref:LysR family transcriptional regulator n=1 Tax=Variovorax sp. TBS-050B TaxID=2940551 RepID=UPI002473E353|nr:LysR family transcriptional regulator [Variovorax sp. TBS-050B]MDH6594419.1 DNA-binding transcriptional LysR family regulator [Variovorax sp. TBS-050B]